MISFIIRRCTSHERRYVKTVILLYCETDYFFQRRKIFRRFFHQFF